MDNQKDRLLIGAHMSIAGGLYQAIERGQSIGCTTIQIFTKSNRQWRAKELTPHDIMSFKKSVNNSNIAPIVAHATYLINIGSPSAEVQQKSIEALIIELQRCQDLAIPYLVLHPGSSLDASPEECLEHIANNLNIVFERMPGNTQILLETMAGQGSAVCYTFEHIAQIIQQSYYKERLGVCLDTCHVFAAGYDLRTSATYEALWKKFNATIGLNFLKVIHVNDSKKDIGSHVDRHANIGEGAIGIEAFRLLMNDSRFFTIPKIIETPKDSLEEDLRNLIMLRSLLSDTTKNLLKID